MKPLLPSATISIRCSGHWQTCNQDRHVCCRLAAEPARDSRLALTGRTSFDHHIDEAANTIAQDEVALAIFDLS